MIDGLWKDVRYAVRSLTRTPAFTITALVTLALGIGANAAIFSLASAVMLRTLPVAAPHELVFVGHRNPVAPAAGVSLISNPPWLARLRQEPGIFTGVAAYNIRDFKVASAEGLEQVVGQYASGNYHALVGVPMTLGRGFTDENDFAPGASPIAVISDSYWQRRYRSSPAAIGSSIVVGGHTVTIVGVTAAGFEGLQPGREIEITLPLSIRVQDEPDFTTSLDSWTNMPLVARLRAGVSASAAEPVVHAAFRDHMATPGIGFGRARDGRFLLTAAVVPAARGADRLRREYEPALRLLTAIVAIVLLIACVNVANLFLARGNARAAEIAMRLAIGAGRWRVVRQLLAEAIMVAAGGCLIGFAAAGWATRYVAALLGESQRPITIDAQPDARVVAFTLAVAGLTTLMFGLAPALRATRSGRSLRIYPASSVTERRSLGRMTLVGGQLAMCVVLVLCAGLLVRTLYNLERVDGRFATDTVVGFALDANDTAVPHERLPGLCTEALARLQGPAVATGSCSTMAPLDTARELRVLGLPQLPPERESRDILANAVTPGYFATFGIDVLRGRLFTAADTAAAPHVAILNEAAARHFFGDANPIGRQIAFGSVVDPDTAMTVVGIVSDVRHQLREAAVPMAYEPLEQMASPPDYLVGAIRVAGDSQTIGARVRSAVRDVTPDLAVLWVRSLRQQMQAALVTERLLASLSVAFGTLALLLAAVGIYGVIAYDVGRRTREIGIRMALGARPRTLLGAVLRQVAMIVIPGIAAGLAISLPASAAVEAFLFGIAPRDPWTFAATSLALALVAFAAAVIPARRAARVNPVMALRAE
ncbi:MAG TPA: ABC transporter permease [Vicinamibacterales bacterium]|nr:ABC transporter permease [Vicinamibacterales bacterium]